MEKDEIMAQLILLRKDVDRAQHAADASAMAVSSHEAICALRYDTINAKLDIIPSVFNKIDIMSSRLNIATGVWIGVLGLGGITGIIYTITRIAHGS